jgi:hypothetical protein
MRAHAILVGLGLSLWALPGAAQESGSAGFSADTGGIEAGGDGGPDEGIPGSLVVGGEIGGIFPQPFSELGSHVVFGVELGYRLPMWQQRLEILFDAGFSPPGNSVSVVRPDGTYEGEIDQQELHFSLGPRGRLNCRERWPPSRTEA